VGKEKSLAMEKKAALVRRRRRRGRRKSGKKMGVLWVVGMDGWVDGMVL
jgi:hypothetical protein